MSKTFSVLISILLFVTAANAQFVTIWDTGNDGVTNRSTITIPATGVNFSITWEEVGNPSNNGTEIGSGIHKVHFPFEGTYQVSISPGSGSFSRIAFANGNDRLKLLEIRQWGDIAWTSMEKAFQGCQNLTITATDIPNLQNTASFNAMFQNCTSLTSVPGMDSWDVSAVRDMSSMFYSATTFNEPIGSWNVSNVTNMRDMFCFASSFNRPIGSWNVGSVTNMNSMFYGARAFNQNIRDWNVQNVTNMGSMFTLASAFNQPIGAWNVSKVSSFSYMFYSAIRFNQPIGDWDLRSATNLSYLFTNAVTFNQPLNNWDVRNVTNMAYLFFDAQSFNQSLADWELSSVTNMASMLNATNLSCENITYTLYSWARSSSTPANITLGARGISYGGQAAVALETLRNEKGWTIDIGGQMICNPLDVSLVSFDVKAKANSVRIEWVTSSETENDYFEVERSADARNWESIGRKKGAGTTATANHYFFEDAVPLDGRAYYRLKIVELNGDTDYSIIQSARIPPRQLRFVYPNPTTGSVTVSGKPKGNLQVSDISGRPVLEMKVSSEKTIVPTEKLPPGTYLFKTDDGWKSTIIKK